METGIERTAEGSRLLVKKHLPVERDRVWDVITDTNQWPDWGPSVRAVECDRQYITAGSTGRVRIPGGLWIPFEITSCREYRWTWRVARIPATGHSVRAVNAGSEVAFELPLYAVGYVPVCARALSRIEQITTDR